MWTRQPANQEIVSRVYKYVFKRGAKGVPSSRIYNVMPYDWDSISDALAHLRDEMTLACTNSKWYVLNRKKT